MNYCENVRWRGSVRNKCPIEIKHIQRGIEAVAQAMERVGDGNLADAMVQAMKMRPMVDAVLADFISMALKGVREEEKLDIEVYKDIKDDVRYMLRHLDKMQEKGGGMSFSSSQRMYLLFYTAAIESIVVSLVYGSIKDACQELEYEKNHPDAKAQFLYLLWAALKRRSGLLYQDARKKDEVSGASKFTPTKAESDVDKEFRALKKLAAVT